MIPYSPSSTGQKKQSLNHDSYDSYETTTCHHQVNSHPRDLSKMSLNKDQLDWTICGRGTTADLHIPLETRSRSSIRAVSFDCRYYCTCIIRFRFFWEWSFFRMFFDMEVFLCSRDAPLLLACLVCVCVWIEENCYADFGEDLTLFDLYLCKYRCLENGKDVQWKCIQ